jgi:large subunit ribosomal protein L13
MAKPLEVEHKWYVVDAEGLPLGRLASQVAAILRGKHKPTFTPNVDTGDFVIIINADKVVLTGNKASDKLYKHYSGWAGGLKETTYGTLLNKKPEFMVEHTIKGMLPHNTLGRKMALKLKVYAGPEHPHQAQKPEPLTLHI